MSVPRALSPLRHPGYRWLGASLALSLAATGLWILAIVWQVVALGGGPGQLSIVTAAGALGMLTTTLLGGALADRVPQRRILVTVEVVRAATVGAVAALSLAGSLEVWHLGVVSLLGGFVGGLYFPAYSALLPQLVPADDLLAANGLEGVLRPIMMQAAGPAVASAIIAAASPGAALAVTALVGAGAGLVALRLPEVAVARDLDASPDHPVRGLFRDVGEGFTYMVRTPWLLATLLFASALILVMMGPFEVLVPFALKAAGGGPDDHAMILAAFGIGGAVGSMAVSSFRLPRRYLSVMTLMWGFGCLPLVVFGLGPAVWVMVAAGFVIGAVFNGAIVIWGTLLQRRVPGSMLGRVSSLDFFVSISLMPVSMALAGPVSDLVGLRTVFLVAGLAPPVLAIATIALARLHRDELVHPLTVAGDEPLEDEPVEVEPVRTPEPALV